MGAESAAIGAVVSEMAVAVARLSLCWGLWGVVCSYRGFLFFGALTEGRCWGDGVFENVGGVECVVGVFVAGGG